MEKNSKELSCTSATERYLRYSEFLVWLQLNLHTAHFSVAMFYMKHNVSFPGETLGVPIHVFGPETHMTAIVGMALGKKKVPPPVQRQLTTANFLLPGNQVGNSDKAAVCVGDGKY